MFKLSSRSGALGGSVNGSGQRLDHEGHAIASLAQACRQGAPHLQIGPHRGGATSADDLA